MPSFRALLILLLLPFSSLAHAKGFVCDYSKLDGTAFKTEKKHAKIGISFKGSESTFSYYQYFHGNQSRFVLYQMTCSENLSCSGYRLNTIGETKKKTEIAILPTGLGVLGKIANRSIFNFESHSEHSIHYSFFEESHPDGTFSGVQVRCHE